MVVELQHLFAEMQSRLHKMQSLTENNMHQARTSRRTSPDFVNSSERVYPGECTLEGEPLLAHSVPVIHDREKASIADLGPNAIPLHLSKPGR